MLDVPLELYSRPGKGSVFAVSVSLTEAMAGQPSADVVSTSVRALASFEGLEVLCIDDDREILDGMRMLLERWGCRVRVAATREEAVSRAHADIDLIIADYHLGGGDDGLSVSAAVRRTTGCDFPVVVLTADRESQLGEQLEGLGYQRLFKPVKPAALRALMRHAVDGARG